MRRRSMLDGKEVRKRVGAHLVFFFILGFGALVRVASEANGDGNVIMFAMVLAIGVILALSLFNQFLIDLFNDLNSRLRIINYCIPAFVVLFALLVFRISVELVDILSLPILILIADLVKYTMTDKEN